MINSRCIRDAGENCWEYFGLGLKKIKSILKGINMKDINRRIYTWTKTKLFWINYEETTQIWVWFCEESKAKDSGGKEDDSTKEAMTLSTERLWEAVQDRSEWWVIRKVMKMKNDWTTILYFIIFYCIKTVHEYLDTLQLHLLFSFHFII